MTQFYGSMQGNRGQATRMGTKESGFDAHIRGWDIGCRVVLRHIDGKDRLSVFRTGGSHGHKPEKLIASFTDGED